MNEFQRVPAHSEKRISRGKRYPRYDNGFEYSFRMKFEFRNRRMMKHSIKKPVTIFPVPSAKENFCSRILKFISSLPVFIELNSPNMKSRVFFSPDVPTLRGIAISPTNFIHSLLSCFLLTYLSILAISCNSRLPKIAIFTGNSPRKS